MTNFARRFSKNTGQWEEIAGKPYRQIFPYEENGEMAPVVWFEVRRQDVEQRVNSKYVRQIIY